MEDNYRYYETTVLSELHGMLCLKLIATRDEHQVYVEFYINASGTWHRFFLDAGLLFWHEGISPNSEEYFVDEYDYIDIGEKFKVNGEFIIRIEMDECVLSLEFGNGTTLKFISQVMDDDIQIVIS